MRYYKDEMTDSEIKAAIEDLLGAPVDRLNKFMGYVTLENGDMCTVWTSPRSRWLPSISMERSSLIRMPASLALIRKSLA
ncbi:MAG: hypothetical protein ACLT1A_08010 [Dysosmobacter sp.]